jgi:hypothetical protein
MQSNETRFPCKCGCSGILQQNAWKKQFDCQSKKPRSIVAAISAQLLPLTLALTTNHGSFWTR